jgi:predicted amidohydrolase
MPTRRAAGGLDGMRVALAQTDCVLGDVDANVEAARDQIRQAVAQGADLVVFPELR